VACCAHEADVVSRTLPERAALAAALLLLFAALAHHQLATRRLLDGDSYFHARAAQQLAEHGVRREFPQAAFSTWRDRYSDKDFLFHVFAIPFVGAHASVPGAKRAVIAADALVLLALGFALVRLRVRFAWLAVALLAASSPWIWLHLLKLRPHLLGLALLLVEIVLLLEGRWKTLAGVAAAHVLAHTSFLALLALPIAHAIARRMRGQPAAWRPAAGIALGIAGASLAHPYFPNNLTIAFDQVVEVARSVAGTRPEVPPDVFGTELMPISLAGFLQLWAVWVPALVCGALLLARWRRAPPSVEVLTLYGFAVALLLASGLANRFAFFFVPVAALATTRAIAELVGERPLRELARAPAALVLAAGLAACVLGGAGATRPNAVAERVARAQAPVESMRDAIAFLDRRAAPGDVVYHNFWIPFAPLYYFRPHGTYIEGLDPIFLYRFDPRLFAGMLAVYRGTADDAHRVVAGDFGARFVFVQKLAAERPMALALARDRRFRVIYDDPHALVFEVTR
jgi:hypothetical protein